MPTFDVCVMFGLVVAPIVWGVMAGINRVLRLYVKNGAWHALLMRLIAIALGAGIGAIAHLAISGVELVMCALMGAGAGALCAFIVKLYKQRAGTT